MTDKSCNVDDKPCNVDDKPCIICLETDATISINELTPNTAVIKTCACTFYTHEKCIATWITNNPTCPYCKKLLSFECCITVGPSPNGMGPNGMGPNGIGPSGMGPNTEIIRINTGIIDMQGSMCITKFFFTIVIILIIILVFDKIFLK